MQQYVDPLIGPYGSVFVVFRAGAAPLADRVVSIRRDGVEISGLAPNSAPEIQLQHESPPLDVNPGGGAGYRLEVAQPGTYELKTAAGRTLKGQVPELPNPCRDWGPVGIGISQRSGGARACDPGAAHFLDGPPRIRA